MPNVAVILFGTMQLWFSKLLLNLLLAFLQMAAQAFPGRWGTDPTVICGGMSAVVTLILLPRCSNESLRASSDVWLWGMACFDELYSWDFWCPTGIHNREVPMLLLVVPCSSKVVDLPGPCQSLKRSSGRHPPGQILSQQGSSLWRGLANWIPVTDIGEKIWLGTTMFVSAAEAGLQ